MTILAPIRFVFRCCQDFVTALTVIVARENALGPRFWAFRPEDWITAVSADIMEAPNVVLTVHDEKIGEPGNLKSVEVPRFLKSAFMSDQHPFLGEYGTPFELV